MKLFGTSGIRGRTFKEITPYMAERIGRAFASYLGGKGRVALGRDTRFGAETVEYATIAGLAAGGVDVERCGEIPSPALAYYTNKKIMDGAVIVTGSHTPSDRIGIIPIMGDGSYLQGEAAEFVEKKTLLATEDFGLVLEPSKAGKIIHCEEEAIESYKEFLLEKADFNLIKSARFRVLVDPGNGTACYYAVEILQALGCDVVPINNKPSGLVNRAPEPRAETLKATLKSLRKEECDLGIAFDLDADRVVFLSPQRVISGNLIGAILVDRILSKAQTSSCLVLPINTSGMISKIIQKHQNSRIVFSKIGQPETIATVKKHPSCVFAFEESGKYYFINEGILWTDGGLAAIRILEILARKNVSLDELTNEYPQYSSIFKSIKIPQGQGQNIFNQVKKVFEDRFKNRITGSLIRLDGLRANFPDGSWLLIRPSGTEPLFRIFADASKKSQSHKLLKEGVEIVKSVLE